MRPNLGDPSETERLELCELWILAKVGFDTRYDRLCYVARAYACLHPEVSPGQAYKLAERAIS